MQTFSKEDLEDLDNLDWKEYEKIGTTKMIKINGPFTVQTSEGDLTCQDGFLAIDRRGFPYPIDSDEHALIYREVGNA